MALFHTDGTYVPTITTAGNPVYIPVPNPPNPLTPLPTYNGIFPPRPIHLSDSEIELMALCIANKHPLVDGSIGCFCMLKRLEKGLEK